MLTNLFDYDFLPISSGLLWLTVDFASSCNFSCFQEHLLNPQGTYKLSQKQLGALRFLRQVFFERMAGKQDLKALTTLASLLCH